MKNKKTEIRLSKKTIIEIKKFNLIINNATENRKNYINGVIDGMGIEGKVNIDLNKMIILKGG